MLKRLVTALVSASLLATPAGLTAEPAPDLLLPSLGTVAGADLSIQEERALGEQLMQRIRASDTYLSDPEASDYLGRLGYRLVLAANSLPYDFLFFPVRNKAMNAFALPGGFIAVHTGLVIAAQNESELAGVISHEIGHVTQRHIARMIERSKQSLPMTIGSVLLALLAARAGGSSGGDAAMGIIMGSQAAMISKELGYSRDAERDADRTGLASLYNAGFDPRGMEGFFERLRQNNRFYESASTAYLSTHPLTSERMNDMRARTRTLPARPYADSLDFLLIQSRLRVLQEKTYDGWLQVIKHFENRLPVLQGRRLAAVHYGLSLAFARINKPAQALEHARKAQQLAGERSIMLEKNASEAEFLAAKTPEQKSAAVKAARAAADRFPDSTIAFYNCAEIMHRAGRDKEAIRFMRTRLSRFRRDPNYQGLLARSYEATGQKALSFAATGEMYALMGNHKAAVYQYEHAQRDAAEAFEYLDANFTNREDIIRAIDKLLG
ncbi:MAG: M48 family metallopeptidase [Duodenibacillus sp.]|nr:M48 family metallopeptidase [Duodenibacillus sp.]